MKRTFAVIITFTVTVLLCACGARSVVQSNLPAAAAVPEASPTPVLTAAPTANPFDEGFEKMLSGFMEIRTGSSGSSLRSVQQAVKLLDWGTATDMNIDEIASRTSAFIQTMDGAVTESYIEQLTMLYETYRLLLTDGQEALLESAGCADTAYPWGGAPIAGIEAIFETAGVI